MRDAVEHAHLLLDGLVLVREQRERARHLHSCATAEEHEQFRDTVRFLHELLPFRLACEVPHCLSCMHLSLGTARLEQLHERRDRPRLDDGELVGGHA